MANPHPGQWESVPPLLDTQQSGVHACVIYNQSSGGWKVLYFFAIYREGANNKVQSRIWNPQDNEITEQDIPDLPGPETDDPFLFCGGHSYMSNGNLLVAGGHRGAVGDQFYGLPYTYVFDPSGERWRVPGLPGPPHKMADGRWYPTLTTLGEEPGYGSVIAMSGFRKDLVGGRSVVNTDPEIYHPNTGWALMENPQQAVQPFDKLYPGAHLVPYGPFAGKIFYSMPMTQAYMFNPFFSGPLPNGGYWVPIDDPRSVDRHAGNSVLLPNSSAAEVLIIGGGDPATVTTDRIDLDSSKPTWANAAEMTYPRRNANAVLLPDDTVLVVGGNVASGFQEPVFIAEAYDPSADAWTVLPSMRLYRMYHSVAILLPDARVWVSGTTYPKPESNYQRNIEIFSPGYLFEGTRPEIVSAPDNISYDSAFQLVTSISIAQVRLIRLGVPTHAIDMDQRSVGLSFETAPSVNGPTYSVTTPANANVAPPGWYMLFVLRAKSESSSGLTAIPSVAKIVKLERA